MKIIMESKLKLFVAVIFLIFSCGCAAINPNPNVGARSVDLMVGAGNCSGALELLNSAAVRGEPWAQLRLGYFAFTKQYSGVSTEEGIKWLSKVACYVPKTDWERGHELSIGSSGFFNTREDSFQASDVLQMAAEANSPTVEYILESKWYWTNVASNLYEADNPKQIPLNARIKEIEKHMTPESLIKAKTLNLCAPFREPIK